MRLSLSNPITALGTVAIRHARVLHAAGISTVRDLLFFYPYRYEDWSKVAPIHTLVSGSDAVVQGTVTSIASKSTPWRKRPTVDAVLTDEKGESLTIVWYNSPFLVKTLPIGTRLLVSGKMEKIRGALHCMHPQWEKISDAPTAPQARIMPVYHLSGSLTQKIMRHLSAAALARVTLIPDYLPSWMLEDSKLEHLDQALRDVHFPRTWHARSAAEQRLKFDELFFLQLRSALARRETSQMAGRPLVFDQAAVKAFVARLPFPLTQAQRKAAWEVIKDLGKKHPMNRLLEGDVGSGKTAVAAIASFHAVHAGSQAACLAPTSILAVQHFETFCKLFTTPPSPPYEGGDRGGVRIALLTQGDTRIRHQSPPRHSRAGGNPEKNKKENDFVFNSGSPIKSGMTMMKRVSKHELMALINQGAIDIVIGTHALLSDAVQIPRLALVIVDEQHRFGVRQRHSLLKDRSGTVPHLLTMTATPIPRSLALVAYGDLDLSILDEMPKGRAAIATRIIGPHQRPQAYALIREELEKGRQAFIICPLIDPSDALGVKSVESEAERLTREHLPQAALAMLHGRMSARKKDQVMKKFSDGSIQVLVATPVVEVGIDVPNATVMLIEGAERFGLAQLHQLRGRVGRGMHPSHCLLATDTESEASLERLRAVAASQNGFALAEKDLAMRGPGEIYGTVQKGFLDELKIAKLTDAILLKQSKEAVDRLLAADPTLQHHPALQVRLAAFEQSIHLE